MKNSGLKSVAVTKQHFRSLRRSTGITHKYRAVKFLDVFKHTHIRDSPKMRTFVLSVVMKCTDLSVLGRKQLTDLSTATCKKCD
jgi:hypothetical protein